MSVQPTNLLTDLSQFVSDFTFSGTGFENSSFESIVNNIHFIRPWWLLAFFGLFLLLFLLKKMRYYQSPWQHFLPAHLASALVENSHSQTAQAVSSGSPTRYWLKPLIIGACTILALAGPAWQKLPQPVYQLERGAVLIMDMSYSMYATDVKPNRLTRARYKAIDLLKKISEGDVGLIAYAGDAFIISPLTQDIKNIELLLPSLSPDIMPIYGANALAALTLADKTLKNAGHISGDIYWFTDDIDNEEMADVYHWASGNNHKVNILGIGSETGAPITLTSGKLLKDNSGAIVIPKLPESRLSAIAQRSRGVYRTMTNNDSDIKALTAHLSANLDDKIDVASQEKANQQQVMRGDQYQEQGPWLLIIILPLLLSYFRRGGSIVAITWLMPLTMLFSLSSISPNSYAAEPNNTKPNIVAPNISTEATPASAVSSASQLWQDLWQTSDQQAQQHYQQQDYQQAAKQFEDSQWQGSAHYKAGDYEQALQAFKQGDSAQALYNQGNALAQLQKVDQAIDAYKEALQKDANLTDAKDNLAQLEALKKQQEEQQKQDQNQDSENQPQDQSEDNQQQDKQGDNEKQQSQDGEKQAQDPSQGEQKSDDAEQSSTEQQQDEKQSDQQAQQSEEANQQEQKEKAEQAQTTDDEQQPSEEESLAQQAIDNKAQETEQKHQQLLNKVTDDPYLLLRNKMRLEYQKRRNEGTSQGVTKKW